MKEAELYKKVNNKVQCNACAHRCIIDKGKRGICGVRENKDGKLYLLVYEKISAYNIDPIEKKPLFHFHPGKKVLSLGTVGCNFKCDFCQNWEISQSPKTNNSILGKKIKIKEIVKTAVENNCLGIAYTYNEPAVFIEFAHDIAVEAKKNGLKNIFVSNGFETKEALDYVAGKIDAMNIDLKSFSDDFYKKYCGGRLQPVLDTIKRLKEKKIWIEITTLIIPGLNDSNEELKKISKFIASIDKNIPWHIIKFFPCYKIQDIEPTPEKILHKAHDIGKASGLKHVYIGNVRNGRESTLCPNCNEICIERDGFTSKIRLKNGKCPKCGKEVKGKW